MRKFEEFEESGKKNLLGKKKGATLLELTSTVMICGHL